MIRAALLLTAWSVFVSGATTYTFSSCTSGVVGAFTGCASTGAASNCTYGGPQPADGGCYCSGNYGCSLVSPGAIAGTLSIAFFDAGSNCTDLSKFAFENVPVDNICRQSGNNYVSALIANTSNYAYYPCQVSCSGGLNGISSPRLRCSLDFF
jgi:hypothetical protein